MVVSTLFVFANILIIVISFTFYHNMERLKFILNGIGIFLTFVTFLVLTADEKRHDGTIVQGGIGFLMQRYNGDSFHI